MKYDINKGYTVINGFGFTALTYPLNIHDAIVIKCKERSDCESPQYGTPYHTVSEYVSFIQENNISKAIIILDDISFISQCPSLKHIKIIPSYQSTSVFDFSPLYQLPKIESISCQTRYGNREQYVSKVDYSRIHGLIDLFVSVNKGTLNYSKVKTLKSLQVARFNGKNHDLTDLFCSNDLDTLRLINCGIHSLNGIDISNKMQCLYLHYNRSLYEISALSKVKETLKALRIENCPKIKDFSVLGKLEKLELLELSGSNKLPNLDFLKSMKSLKLFIFNMNVEDGNLSPCMYIPHVYSEKDRRHYNLKNMELPKGQFAMGNEDIEEWRRLE